MLVNMVQSNLYPLITARISDLRTRIESLICVKPENTSMSEDNEFNTLHEAMENSSDDQAVVDLGFGEGYELIHRDDW